MQTLPHLLFFLLPFSPAPASEASAPAADPLCADSGYCHFPRWTSPADGPEARAGWEVAVHGNFAAVAAPGDDTVRIHVVLSGAWTENQVLECPTGPDSSFGNSLVLGPDRLYVGAPSEDTAAAHAGAVFVYERSGIDFVLVETLYSPAPEAHASFGSALDEDDGWLLVGEPGADPGGRAHVFEVGPAGHDHFEVLEREGSLWFGFAVALSGEHAVVSDPLNDFYGAASGAVFTYWYWDAGDEWKYQHQMWSSTPAPGDLYGAALAADTDRLVVGSPRDSELADQAGAVFVYERDHGEGGTVWDHELEQKITSCDVQELGRFGGSVAYQAGRLVVGATNDEGINGRTGKVYTFRPPLFFGGWYAENEIRAADGANGDEFGWAVALHEDRLLVGATGVDGSGDATGAAYMFSCTPDTEGGGACPAPYVASTLQISSGKPGTLGYPELRLNKPLVPGEDSLVILENVPKGSQPILMWGLEFAQLPFDESYIYMSDPHIVLLPVPTIADQVGLSIDVLDGPGLAGLRVILQAAFLDPGAAGDYGVALSNTLFAWIGY